MSLPHTPSETTAVAGLPGVQVIARIRRLLILAVIAALVYPALMVASRATCPGGIDGSGGFIDGSGLPVDEAPLCIQLTLGPSPLVYAGIAAIVLIALGRVMKASDEHGALKVLNRAAIGVGALVAVAIVISHVWFFLIPMEGFTSDSWTVVSPFPFGNIDVTTTPMTME
ncbi:hypothetical protein QYR02_07150 [Microbacterium maritypicum]|uniref:hypothetical protein n=1 Tax=Microbacterium maritypicum TaxID=33918 RepID=UPI002672FC8F|nr:hypothetical protein [Microbacterium liquefaciens]WKT90697.1 hypothetical protein QYR02_07150 [Microbacterium liquefaciens]